MEDVEEIRKLYLFALTNHVLWSTLPVASRYLQVYANPMVFDGQGVLATSKAMSALLLFFCSPLLCPDLPTQPASSTREVGEEENMNCLQSFEATPQQPSVSTQTKLAVAVLFGIVATCRASLNIASAKFTFSYYISAINSLSPLVIALGDKILLQTDLPSALWPCVGGSIFGCVTIAVSKSPLFLAMDDNSEDQSVLSFSSYDAIGCSLQFLSMCFSAMARLLMKRTEHVLSRDEAVQANNICNCLFPLLYTLLTNPGGWKAFTIMTASSLFAWFTIAVVVYTLGSTGQMSLVRSMGPGRYSCLGAVRVLGSAIFSAVWLHEPVKNWLESMGLGIVMVTMTLYTLISVNDFNCCSRMCCFLVEVEEEESMEAPSNALNERMPLLGLSNRT